MHNDGNGEKTSSEKTSRNASNGRKHTVNCRYLSSFITKRVYFFLSQNEIWKYKIYGTFVVDVPGRPTIGDGQIRHKDRYGQSSEGFLYPVAVEVGFSFKRLTDGFYAVLSRF